MNSKKVEHVQTGRSMSVRNGGERLKEISVRGCIISIGREGRIQEIIIQCGGCG